MVESQTLHREGTNWSLAYSAKRATQPSTADKIAGEINRTSRNGVEAGLVAHARHASNKLQPYFMPSGRQRQSGEVMHGRNTASAGSYSHPSPPPPPTLARGPSSGEEEEDDKKMAEEEASEKISLHTLDDAEERAPVKELTWREKVAHFMSTNKVQYTIIVLVVLDSLIVIFELLIDMDIIIIPEDHHHQPHTGVHDNQMSINGSSSGHPLDHNTTHLHPAAGPLPTHYHNHTLLHSAIAGTFRNHSANATAVTRGGEGGGGASEGSGGVVVVEGGGSGGPHPGGQGQDEGEGRTGAGEGQHHAPNKHLTEHVLHMGSLTILTIFLVEVTFKVYAEGKHLLKHKAEVFDAIVVVVSFTMDITFTVWPVDQVTRDYAGLLVLLRLWRVTRIINGVILSVQMDADKKLKAQKALKEKAEKQVQKLTDKLEKLTRENQKLRTRLALLEGRNGNNADPTTTATTTPDDNDEDDPHSPARRGSRHSSWSTARDDSAACFTPRESSLPQLAGAGSTPTTSRRDGSSLHSHGASPGSVSATSPTQGEQRRSAAMRYGFTATPQSGRRSEGSCSSLRTPPIESQQLLSFEEPVSEEAGHLAGIRDPEIGMSPSVVGGKLVTSVS